MLFPNICRVALAVETIGFFMDLLCNLPVDMLSLLSNLKTFKKTTFFLLQNGPLVCGFEIKNVEYSWWKRSVFSIMCNCPTLYFPGLCLNYITLNSKSRAILALLELIPVIQPYCSCMMFDFFSSIYCKSDENLIQLFKITVEMKGICFL